jgi:aldose 1-epimerase
METKHEKDGETITAYKLTSEHNGTVFTATLLDLGATLSNFTIGDADVVLGFDDVFNYKLDANPYFGAVVGRSCNRTAGGKFTLNGTEYSLPINNGPNSLHGGVYGLSRKMWQGRMVASNQVAFTCTSPHVRMI